MGDRRYELVARACDADAGLFARAADIVRDFIVERGCILYGGLALDYVMRLRGCADDCGADDCGGGGCLPCVYPAEARPDFDFFSPRAVEDAYDLAERLAAAGLPQVGAVHAVHVQTMHVRTNFLGVADISFVPPAVFAGLRTLDFRGMRVLHPDLLRRDMHLALCFPLAGAPREDVFHRFAKDLRRFALLDAAYPWAMPAPPAPPAPAPDAAVAFDPDRAAVHGLAAFGLYRRHLAGCGGPVGGLPEVAAAVGTRGAGPRARVLKVAGRSWLPAALAAQDADAAAWAGAGGTSARRLRPFLDVRPAVLETRLGGRTLAEVHLLPFRRLAVSRLGGTPVVSTQYLLLYFLHLALAAPEEPVRTEAAAFYGHTLELVARAARLPPAQAAPFLPLCELQGEHNYGEAYRMRLARSVRGSGLPLPPGSPLAGALPALDALPPPFYPSERGRESRPAFETRGNPLFERDGGAEDAG